MKKSTREISAMLIECLEHDNGAEMLFTIRQLNHLEAALSQMQLAGCIFSPEDISLLACGEQSEVKKRFRRFKGFKETSEALNSIFDHPDGFAGLPFAQGSRL